VFATTCQWFLPTVDEDDLKAALSKFLKSEIFENQSLLQYRQKLVKDGQFQLDSVLPANLQLRALHPFINPSQALARKDTTTVNWYVAFVDRVDDVVEAGRLHRWGRCEQGNSSPSTSFQKELSNIMTEMKREFSSYLRGYKDECIQYIWQHEYELQDGTGFSADDAKWLKWLQDFIAQCIETSKVHYVLPDYYFSAFYHDNKVLFEGKLKDKKKYIKPSKSELPSCIDYSQVNIQSLTFFRAQVSAKNATTIQKTNEKLGDEFSVSNRLVLRHNHDGSELYITIGEKNRERDLNAYTSHWAIVAVNDASRYSYLHIQFIKTFIAEVARIRLRKIKNQLQQQLEVTFRSEDSINQAYKKFVPEPVESISTKENRLANQILALIQTQFLKPFLGLDSPMLLVTQNTNKHPVHLVSNTLLDKQFGIDDENRFSFLKASLGHILRVFTQLGSSKGHEVEQIDKPSDEYRLRDYQACEFTSEGSTLIRVLDPESSNSHAESTRGLETGRYSLAFKLAFMPEQYFDGVVLFVGRAEPFDKWTCYCLAEISKAIIPALSVSFINQQSLTQLGLIQHALNSPAQGIISLAKESIRNCQKALSIFSSLEENIYTEKAKLLNQLIRNKDEINLLANEIRSWKIALNAIEGKSLINVSEQHNLVSDLMRWIKRFQSRANDLGLRIVIDIPFESLYITYSPLHLDIAFSNLLDNAIKYSRKKGKIQIKLKLSGAKVQRGAYKSRI